MACFFHIRYYWLIRLSARNDSLSTLVKRWTRSMNRSNHRNDNSKTTTTTKSLPFTCNSLCLAKTSHIFSRRWFCRDKSKIFRAWHEFSKKNSFFSSHRPVSIRFCCIVPWSQAYFTFVFLFFSFAFFLYLFTERPRLKLILWDDVTMK